MPIEGRSLMARAGSELLTPGAGSPAATASSTTWVLEVRVLGPFEVRLGDDRVAVSGSKREALLAVLGLARGRVLAVEELIDAVWGEDLPAAPRNALQHHVARLRAALGSDAIVASPHGYALQDAWVDAPCFEELLAKARVDLREGDARAASESVSLALELWRGPALEGLTDTSWLRSEAQRLEGLHVDALEEKFEAALALGENREIVSGLETAVEDNPFRERLWGQLMLALYRSGRQADALEAFQEARRVLSTELGLEPGPELRGLQEAILAQDPAIAPIPVAPRRRGNLPAASTSFVDRKQELARVVGLLGEHRLVTLVGPPGVGKTRLALEAMRASESELRDGAWLVELARAGEGSDVARLVAQAVGARGGDPLTAALARLREADAVVLFDACEHELAGAARVIATVLADCTHVRVLATSREALHLVGGARLTVAPLPLDNLASDDGAGSPAVELFAARASAARPGFALTDQAAPLAAEIARCVDGLPLAIELAAARLGVLGLAELATVVQRRRESLRGGPESDPTRTALQALVDWSYELLHADEKALLHLIAVHRGGASLPSLAALGAKHELDEASVTYLLGALVDKSIVSVGFPEEEARYDLLDTVRDYALERLAEADQLAAVRQAHAEYFATLADQARSGLRGSGWLTWAARLGRENENLWTALRYARDAPDPGIAIRLGASLLWYFSLERISEGRQFVELAATVASEDAPVQLWVDLLASLCFLATEELDLDAAVAAGERALGVAARAFEPCNTAEVRALLSIPLTQRGQYDRAAKLAEDARESAEAAGDHWAAAVAGIVAAERAAVAGDLASVATLAANVAQHSRAIDYLLTLLPATLLQAWAAERRGENDEAIDAYRRAIELANQAGFGDHTAFALARMGGIALAEGQLRQAEDLCRRALAAADAEVSPWTAAYARVQLGRVLAAAGEADPAARLFRNVLELSERPQPHRARESLQLMLAGSPRTTALLGLAELAEDRGEVAAAAALRGQAAPAPA